MLGDFAFQDRSRAGPPLDPPRPTAGWVRRGWPALAAIAILIAAALGGALLLRSMERDADSTFVEFFLTDLPADFSRVEVLLEGVYVGAAGAALTVERPVFDLLALQGPADALRVASGQVPGGAHQDIRVVFQSVRVELDHKWTTLAIPRSVLHVEHDFGIGATESRSILFDINLDESIRIDGAKIEFAPVVSSVYVHAPGEAVGEAAPASSSAPASDAAPPSSSAPVEPTQESSVFTSEEPEDPNDQELESTPPAESNRNPFASHSAPADPTPEFEPEGNDSASDDVAANETADEDSVEGDEAPEGIDPADYAPTVENPASVPADYAGTILGWFVQFVPEASSPEAMAQTLQDTGAELVYRFESVPAAYILGTPPEAEAVTSQANVSYLEPDVQIDFLLSTSKTAIQLPDLLGSTLRDPDNAVFDGRGVGVAVVDTGIDGLHPDLPHRLLEGDDAVVRANYKVESIALVDQTYTDTTSGHGTHVAGIVAGQGTKDSGMRGVAPGVKLYGFGIGEATTLLWPNQAFDWIVQNHDKVDPPIRVVTNSWGSKGAYDPNSLTTQLANQLVAEGVVVVFSAGNWGGDGSADTTSIQCKIPRAGVICVGAYDDGDSGILDGGVPTYSSRGDDSDATTWPDLVAPGSGIKSTRSPFGWVTGVGLLDYYVELDGTSMAAPHVAGAAALMIQAHGSITPAQVESLLKSTALEFDDLGAYNSAGAHYAKGHGLLDVDAAVRAADAL